MNGEILTALIAVLSSSISGYVTYLFTKRKYNAEVDNNLIENMKDSLEFYKSLADDNKDRLEEILDKNRRLEEEMRELKIQIVELSTSLAIYKQDSTQADVNRSKKKV